MLVSELLEREQLTPRELADRFSAAGIVSIRGNKIQPSTIQTMADREKKVPARWFEVLTGSPLRSPGGDGGSDGLGGAETPAAEGRREAPPQRPDGAPVLLPVPRAGAQKRIAGGYRFLGGLLASGAGSPGIAAVWNDSADPIAEIWIQAAQENPWAARFVRLMEAGGVTGDLVAAHAMLLGGTLYVVGATLIPDSIGDTVWAKYSPHRAAHLAAVREAAERNGQGPEAAEPAEGPLVDSPV